MKQFNVNGYHYSFAEVVKAFPQLVETAQSLPLNEGINVNGYEIIRVK